MRETSSDATKIFRKGEVSLGHELVRDPGDPPPCKSMASEKGKEKEDHTNSESKILKKHVRKVGVIHFHPTLNYQVFGRLGSPLLPDGT